jgi:hypothetical protein
MAFEGETPVAGALNFIGRDALYGRQWGTLVDRPFLHFELCYYQAIDFAISRGLSRVEAGAQGEHKIARGYLPSPVYSAHFIADPALREVPGPDGISRLEAVATLHLTPGIPWVTGLAEAATSLGGTTPVGLSIDAMARVRPGTTIVDAVPVVRSCDVVTRASAGGRFLHRIGSDRAITGTGTGRGTGGRGPPSCSEIGNPTCAGPLGTTGCPVAPDPSPLRGPCSTRFARFPRRFA